MSAWQTIETAPLDGTWILVGSKRYWPPFAVRYRPMLGMWLDQWGHGFEPTHWMHFPDPPDQEPNE